MAGELLMSRRLPPTSPILACEEAMEPDSHGARGQPALRAHAGFDREQKNNPISERISPGVEFGEDGSNLFVADDLRLLPERHRGSIKVIGIQCNHEILLSVHALLNRNASLRAAGFLD
jgi:hypothetical protein